MPAQLKIKYSTTARRRDSSGGINVSVRVNVTEVSDIPVTELISAPSGQRGGILANSYCSKQ